MISDNASTFMAAADELKRLFQSATLHEHLTTYGIEWKFIPCRTPWYGGYWERLVGLTKQALKKTLGRAHVTLPSLQTLVVEIEAHLNNRPLTYVCSDFNDPQPLMPSHLLYTRMINTLPHPIVKQDELVDNDYCTGPLLHDNLNKEAKAQAVILQHFWNRWKCEYLTSLRETHTANGSNKETIRVGDIVIVHDDVPRNKWRLAIVKELQRGRDNLVRAAYIQTTTGVTSRPITKLYPLEINVKPTCDNRSEPQTESQPLSKDKPQSSTRSHRTAANKARSQITAWSKILGAPEDVTD